MDLPPFRTDYNDDIVGVSFLDCVIAEAKCSNSETLIATGLGNRVDVLDYIFSYGRYSKKAGPASKSLEYSLNGEAQI